MDVDAWLDRFFESYYRHRPVNATFIGVHDHDDRLPDFSNNGVADVTGDMWNLLQTLEGLDRGNASDAQATDLKLAEGFLRVQLWEYGSKHFHNGNPSVYTSEAVFGPLSLMLREGTPLAGRLDAAHGRFDRIPQLLDQARENIKQAPTQWIEKAMKECLGGANLAAEGVPGYLDANGVEHPRLVESAKRAAAAFEAYREYLRDEMLPGGSDDGYSCGQEGLDLAIRSGHHLDKSATEIVDYARGVMEECRGALEEGASQFGASTWQEALASLSDHHPTAEGYLDAYQTTWDQARQSAVEQSLVTWPDYPIRYVERPTWVRSASPYLYFLFYRAPSVFDSVDVYDYLVEPLPEGDPEPVLRAQNWTTIKFNHVVHHGGIGHHVQNWNAYRAESRIGRVAAVDCASRVAMLCGGTMAEGWSCYTTDLMSEFGFSSPLESFSQIQGRMRMAARAVADVELHAGRMSLEDTVVFYRDQAGMNEAAAMGEAVKNSMNPGAALMYLTGTDLIRDLRHDLIDDATGAALGSFHDRFLSYGSIPVSLISDAMRAKSAPEA